jgi:mono/diheme cytochrome c family protein
MMVRAYAMGARSERGGGPGPFTVAIAVLVATVLCAGRGEAGPSVERGRYLVERVAMCGECHTPRGHDGTLDRERWLGGAPVVVQPPAFVTAWAIEAPRIAGLATYSDEQALRLFTEGLARNGQPLRPPMPQFRFTRDDAEAVLAYLRAQR